MEAGGAVNGFVDLDDAHHGAQQQQGLKPLVQRDMAGLKDGADRDGAAIMLLKANLIRHPSTNNQRAAS